MESKSTANSSQHW
ncbi:unnamed protein product [Linum tenue]|uniref:Uncharacterized protein n=1 Tax=Linum tenue TaxID=586396 RepID=A0AAV0QPG5_9ROSI|nr:unnamed protein product [Linum tenue]CAI0546058.1 unnamed protein product [Linum tenue]